MNILSRRTLVLKLFFVLTAVFFITPVLFLYEKDLRLHIQNLQERLNVHNDPDKEFIEKAVDLSNTGEYSSKALSLVCEETQWTEGLIFTCEGLQGGIGNFRNVLLNCVRFTIEAGAGFLIPTFTVRNLSALETGKTVNFDSFFDPAHFRSTLQGACPQMKFYNHRNDLFDKPTISNPPKLNPWEIAKKFRHGLVLSRPNHWRPALDRWLANQLAGRYIKTVSAGAPVLVNIHRPVFTFPTTYDSRTFKNNFGHILQPSHHIRSIVAKILQTMSSRYALDMDPSARIHSSAYLGVHLRTVSDMLDQKPPSYTEQAPFYLSHAASQNLTTIYVASHNASDIGRFRSDAAKVSRLNVTTASELLTGDDLAAFKALTREQKGLVEYQVLSQASYFVGVAVSTFSWSVAMRRHVWSTVLDPLRAANASGVMRLAFEDERSCLVGETEHAAVLADAMWP